MLYTRAHSASAHLRHQHTFDISTQLHVSRRVAKRATTCSVSLHYVASLVAVSVPSGLYYAASLVEHDQKGHIRLASGDVFL